MIVGFTVVRNAIALDFCLELCVQSMLDAGCDSVWVCDSDSDDGTNELLQAWQSREPRLHLLNRPWSNPVGDIGWLLKWMHYTQAQLPVGPNVQHLYLDADEVLDPASGPVLQAAPPDRCFWFHRHNYWRDVRHAIPFGTVCSHEVARFGPSTMPMHSDEIHDGVDFPLPEPEMRIRAIHDARLVIHHYGFLRHRAALLEKVEGNLRAFFGHPQDVRLVAAIAHPEQHWTEFCPFKKPMRDTSHVVQPALAQAWLRARNAL